MKRKIDFTTMSKPDLAKMYVKDEGIVLKKTCLYPCGLCDQPMKLRDRVYSRARKRDGHGASSSFNQGLAHARCVELLNPSPVEQISFTPPLATSCVCSDQLKAMQQQLDEIVNFVRKF